MRVLAGLAGLALVAASPAAADPYSHAEAGIEFDTPKGWKVDQAENGLTLLSPDETVFAMFLVPQVASVNDLSKVLDQLGSVLDTVISDATYTNEQGTEGQLNGMQCLFVDGEGKVEGAAVKWEVVILSQKAPLIILTVVQPEGQAAHEKAIEGFVKSIRPMKGAAPAKPGTSVQASAKAGVGAAKPAKPAGAKATGGKASKSVPKPGKAKGTGKPVAQGGEVYTHAEGGIQFTVPKAWTVEAEEDTLSAGPKDGTLSVVFWVLPDADPKNAEAAIQALDSALSEVMTDVEVPGDAAEGNQNGMATLGLEGTGKIEGTEVGFQVVLIAGKKPVMALAMAEPASFQSHQKDWDAFVDSVKPAK